MLQQRLHAPETSPHSFLLLLPLCCSEAEFGKGLHDWVEIIVKTNGYFTETKPWELKKKDTQRCDAVVRFPGGKCGGKYGGKCCGVGVDAHAGVHSPSYIAWSDYVRTPSRPPYALRTCERTGCVFLRDQCALQFCTCMHARCLLSFDAVRVAEPPPPPGCSCRSCPPPHP